MTHDIYINRFTIISLPGVNTSFQFTFYNKITINEHAFLSTYVFLADTAIMINVRLVHKRK